MPTNPKKYMRDYMRRQRKPYKLLSINEALSRMGFLPLEPQAQWAYRNMNSLNIKNRFTLVRYPK